MLLPYISVVDVITTEADVTACYILFYWLRLLPIFVADVIATYLAPCVGRCYCQVAGGKAIVGWVDIKWLMLLPQGRCYSHESMILF